jgi:hypothetical protein
MPSAPKKQILVSANADADQPRLNDPIDQSASAEARRLAMAARARIGRRRLFLTGPDGGSAPPTPSGLSI